MTNIQNHINKHYEAIKMLRNVQDMNRMILEKKALRDTYTACEDVKAVSLEHYADILQELVTVPVENSIQMVESNCRPIGDFTVNRNGRAFVKSIK